MRWQACAVVALLGGMVALQARADSWLAPCPEAVLSPQGQYRLVVMPRGGLGRFCTAPAVQRLAAGRVFSSESAMGTLERLRDGHWERVWSAALTNRTRPAKAAVSDAGLVATFDNWFGTGWGDNAVALYGPQGQLIRRLALTDFLPKPYVHVLPRSVSSIWWGGGHAYSQDGHWLVLKVAVPVPEAQEGAASGHPDQVVELRLDARTGVLEHPSGPAWQRALTQASRIDAQLCEQEKADFERGFRRPLTDFSPQDGRDEMGACGPNARVDARVDALVEAPEDARSQR